METSIAATKGSAFDIGRPFVYVFEDKNWITKVLLGGAVFFGSFVFAILLVGLVGFMLIAGYQRRVAIGVAEGAELPIPELFAQPGEDILTGLKMMAIGFVYVLPALLLRLAGVIVMVVLSAASGGDDDVAAVGGLVMIGTSCLALPLQLLGTAFAMMGVIRFWDTGEMGAAFRLGEVWAFAKRQWVNLLLSLVVMMGAGIAAEMVGLLLLCIGIFFTMFWSNLAAAHAFGQIIRIDRATRGSL
jgi:hypothetical protein